MDDALIKPQHVRRVAKLQAGPDGVEADVSAQGTLVEVADPRALRPRDFRTDFVYRPTSSGEDVALCELPPLLENVLSGTDAVLLVCGSAGADQAELLDGPEGMPARAVAHLAGELQARKARHRSGGSGGYSFFVNMHVFQLMGDRVEDLLTDRPEAARITDGPQGVVVEGLRSATVAGPEDAAKVLEMAWRRQDPDMRTKSAKIVEVAVTQADYFAGWGLFGRMLIVETPALDCFAEDRGLVQLREGFDTFRGVYHLRNLVHTWQPRQPGEVTGAALTWILRDILCGGSVSATVLLCLRQQQPSVSLALLEFLDGFSKVETNPICCDHRVAGLLRSLRAEVSVARGHAGAAQGGDVRETSEDTRRIILELEKRLHNAERVRDDALRNQQLRQNSAVDFRERYTGAIQGQEAMHDRLLTSEEEHLRACEGFVEAQLECEAAKEELGELRYKDNLMLMVLEQEVVDTQASQKHLQASVVQLEEQAASVTGHRSRLEEQLRLAAEEAECRAEEVQVSEGVQQGQVAASAAEKARADRLRLHLDAAVEARVAREIEIGNLENRLESLRVEAQHSALNSARQRDEELRDTESKLAGPRQELQELRRALSTCREEAKLEAAAERRATEAASERAAELVRLREEFHRSLASLAVPEDQAKSPAQGDGAAASGGMAAARAQLEALHKQGWAREQRLQEDVRRLGAHVRELQHRLVWSSQVALDWAPAAPSAEGDKAQLRNVVADARGQAEAATAAGGGREREARLRGEALNSELEAERQRLSTVKAEHARERQREQAEHARERQRQDVEVSRLRAEVQELRQGGGAADGLPPMSQIQQQLRSEVEALRGGAGGAGGGGSGEDRRLREENESLRSRLEKLERQLPSDQRAQAQRLAFLERSSRSLEAERSELLVRATVAEEQLVQLQKHLKEMTESYQMQILQLKLQARGQ